MEKEYWLALLALLTALVGLVAAVVGRRKVHEVRVRRDDAATDDDEEVLAPIVKDATGKDYADHTSPTESLGGKPSVPRSPAGTGEPGEPFRAWLVRSLREQNRLDAAAVAEQLFRWADENGYRESGNRTSSTGGALRFAVSHAGQSYEVFAFGGTGEIWLPFQYMQTGPFVDHQMRREYRDRVGKIAGVLQSCQRWENVNGWPAFPLEVLHEPAKLRQFLEVIEWAAGVIRGTPV